MARNRVQFQKGLSEARFAELYGSEDRCREAAEVDGGRALARVVAVDHFGNLALGLGREDLERAGVAVGDRAVEGERSKLRLNSATLLDVVNLENLLQQARVTHVNTLAAHAVAIAALRFQAGQLLAGEGDTQLLTLDRLLAWRPPAAPAALPPR